MVANTSFLLFILYALLPDSWIESYSPKEWTLPSKDWLIIWPIYTVALIPFTICCFVSINMINTKPWDSISLIVDDRAEVLDLMSLSSEAFDRLTRDDLIPEILDIPLSIVNKCWSSEMY